MSIWLFKRQRPFLASTIRHQNPTFPPLFSTRSHSFPRKSLPFSSNFRNRSPTLNLFRYYAYASGPRFDAATSPFPSHRELHSKNPPSNELIRYMRRWDEELRLDAKNAQPRWTPQQRHVMMAACVHFRLRYNPNTEWRVDRLREALAVWEKGVRVDSQSRQPRWNATLRRRFKENITKRRKRMAADAAARMKKKKEDEELGGFWGKIELALVASAFCVMLISTALYLQQKRAERRAERVLERLRRSRYHQNEMRRRVTSAQPVQNT